MSERPKNNKEYDQADESAQVDERRGVTQRFFVPNTISTALPEEIEAKKKADALAAQVKERRAKRGDLGNTKQFFVPDLDRSGFSKAQSDKKVPKALSQRTDAMKRGEITIPSYLLLDKPGETIFIRQAIINLYIMNCVTPDDDMPMGDIDSLAASLEQMVASLDTQDYKVQVGNDGSAIVQLSDDFLGKLNSIFLLSNEPVMSTVREPEIPSPVSSDAAVQVSSIREVHDDTDDSNNPGRATLDWSAFKQ